MAWEKLPELPGQFIGCGTCGFKPQYAEMERRIAVGFGDAYLAKDGKSVWSEDGKDWHECMTFAQAEEMAAADPDHDWRVVLYGPLSGVTYQRHEAGKWALVAKNMGFA